jgi:hypothetical protein
MSVQATVPLRSPRKQRQKHVTYSDDFNENLLRRMIFDMSLR